MDDLYEAAGRFVERAALMALDAPNTRIDILIAGDEQIRVLNRDYRGVDAPTDTLAFPPDDDSAEFGSIALSIETAERQAKNARRSLSHELARLAVHAALHLIGHAHHGDGEAERMAEAEATALAALQQDSAAAALARRLDQLHANADIVGDG